MAFTIQQLQDFSNTKPELRYVTEQIIDYLQANPGGGGASYLVYTALLTQTGTDAPIATVLENTLGGNIIWSYDSSGTYVGTLAGAFPAGKVVIFLGNTIGGGAGNQYLYASDIWSSPDAIYVNCVVNGIFTDGQMTNNPLEIRVYP